MTVFIVGAGPGAADLLTVRGLRMLQKAPVVLYAGSLVPVSLLSETRSGARLIDTQNLDLDAIIAEVSAAPEAGLDVVRLHSGDPSVFSAVAEQVRRLDALGIPYEIVPGLTAFAAAAASLGLTRIARAATPMPPGETLAAFGATGATLVLHLAVQAIAEVVAELMPHYGTYCPVAVVAYASRDDELILRGTLGSIAAQVREAGVKRTAVIVVGKVLTAEHFPGSHLYSPARSRT